MRLWEGRPTFNRGRCRYGYPRPRRATPLHMATRLKHTGVVRLMLWKGANPSIPNNRGNTPIHCAAKWGDPLVVGMLLSRGAVLNGRDEEGRTPLLLAAKFGYVVVVKLLLEKGPISRPEIIMGEVCRNGWRRKCSITRRDAPWRHQTYHWSIGSVEKRTGRLLHVCQRLLGVEDLVLRGSR